MKTTNLLFVIIALTVALPVAAQNVQPAATAAYVPGHTITNTFAGKDSLPVPAKKWFITRYAGISSSFSFFNGGNATILSVPLGVQLNRRLSNNWYAFAGLSVAPSYINFNNSFLNTNTAKNFQGNNMMSVNSRFNMYTRAEMGLMYINDQKTFSISGSIGIEKSSYPWLSPALGTGFRPVPMPYGLQ